MRWPRPIYTILPFIHILVGGAALYRADSFVGIAAGTLLVVAGAIILQMRHDCQQEDGTESYPCRRLKMKEQHEQSPGTTDRDSLGKDHGR